MNHIFRLFRHVPQYLVHYANNETAAIKIFSNAHQKSGDTLHKEWSKNFEN